VGFPTVAIELPHPEIKIGDGDRLAAGKIDLLAAIAWDVWGSHTTASGDGRLNPVLSPHGG